MKSEKALVIASDVLAAVRLGVIAWTAAREILDRLWALLDRAQAEGRDLTDEELDASREAAVGALTRLSAAVR